MLVLTLVAYNYPNILLSKFTELEVYVFLDARGRWRQATSNIISLLGFVTNGSTLKCFVERTICYRRCHNSDSYFLHRVVLFGYIYAFFLSDYNLLLMTTHSKLFMPNSIHWHNIRCFIKCQNIQKKNRNFENRLKAKQNTQYEWFYIENHWFEMISMCFLRLTWIKVRHSANKSRIFLLCFPFKFIRVKGFKGNIYLFIFSLFCFVRW